MPILKLEKSFMDKLDNLTENIPEGENVSFSEELVMSGDCPGGCYGTCSGNCVQSCVWGCRSEVYIQYQ